MSKIKNGGLDQYGAGHFEQRQFGTAGVEGVKHFFYGFQVINARLFTMIFAMGVLTYFCMHLQPRSIDTLAFIAYRIV